MIPVLNTDYLEAIVDRKKEIKHEYYDKTVEHQVAMGVHVEGDLPKDLLDITRPNETEEVKQYRLDIWQPVTMGLSEKIINTVNRIFNDRFFKIKFPAMSAIIAKEESLDIYTMERFPQYRTIISFIKETFTMKDFSDPNALMVIEPEELMIPDTQRFDPVPVIYKSEQIIDFVENEYYTIRLDEKNIKFISSTEISRWTRVVQRDTFEWIQLWMLPHEIGVPPAFRLGGAVRGLKDPYWYFSFIGGVLPHWNRVVTLSSDLDANYINHLYMERWEYMVECEECHGKKTVLGDPIGNEVDGGKPYQKQCPSCSGTGSVSRGPYGVYQVRRDALNPELPPPTPPGGFLDKPLGIVEIIEKRVENEKAHGLSSVNMEILNNIPAPESGIAKAIDRQDLDSFLMRYSVHIFRYVLPQMFEYTSWWRYGATLGWSKTEIEAIQPEIDPMREMDFSVLSLQFLTEEYKNATTAKVGAPYIRHLESEIVNTRFSGKEMERAKQLLIVQLQPFPAVSVDDLGKIASLSGQEDWEVWKSYHLEMLVDKAIQKDSDFMKRKFATQRETIDKLAKEMMGEVQGIAPIVPNQSQFPDRVMPNLEPEVVPN